MPTVMFLRFKSEFIFTKECLHLIILNYTKLNYGKADGHIHSSTQQIYEYKKVKLIKRKRMQMVMKVDDQTWVTFGCGKNVASVSDRYAFSGAI